MSRSGPSFSTTLVFALTVLAVLLFTAVGCKKTQPLTDHPPDPVTGSAPAAVADPDLEDSAHLRHTIAYPGETLTLIAKWYTGDAANWRRIAELNRISSPTALRIGQVIVIPKALLKRDAPMPRSILEEQARPSPTQPAAPLEDPSPEPEISAEQPADSPEEPSGESRAGSPSSPSGKEPSGDNPDAQRPNLIIAPPR